ncbi:hypothetical protein SNE40_018686 [Patella caerulea]|uniref:Transmembrane protein 35B n=1 Tax=Patella caerulea TaxID=87958 RepID=A0AAN8P4D2_PATCE
MLLTAQNVLQKFLSAVYVLAGGMKIYPPTDAMKIDMNKTFKKFAEVCPTVLVGYQPPVVSYRVSLGSVELLLGIGLLLGPKTIQKVSCGVLLIIMAGAVQTMVSLQEYTQVIVPGSLFIALLYYYKCLSVQENKKVQ